VDDRHQRSKPFQLYQLLQVDWPRSWRSSRLDYL